MKKVLIITYYWPPGGGVGVQRWVKITRYLRDYGWEPVIYTALDGEMPVIDQSMELSVAKEMEVIRRPVLEPYSVYRKLLGIKKGEDSNAAFLEEQKKPGALQKFAIWVRGNFFIPDARKFWVKPSIRFLTNYLKQHPVDAIISTGPPHSMHLIAMGVKKKLHLPWIADFRDPWTKIDFYNDLRLSKWADQIHHRLEKEVLLAADKTVTVSPAWAADFNMINHGNTTVITNGYDEADLDPDPGELYSGFLLHHTGMVNKARNPERLWIALRELAAADTGFKNDLHIQLTGKTDYTVRTHIRENDLETNTTYTDHLSHREVIRSMQRSPILLLLLNDTQDIAGRIPAKLFEYLSTGRPILAIADPAGDAAAIINETKAGVVADLNNKEDIKQKIRLLYDQYRSGQLRISSEGIEKYTRRETAKQFAALLSDVVKYFPEH